MQVRHVLGVLTLAAAAASAFPAALPPPGGPGPHALRASAGEVLIGLAHPLRSATLAFDQPGRVAEVAIEPGAVVRSGDLLLRLEDDPATHRVELSRLRADSRDDIELAHIVQRFADNEYERLTQLGGQSLASPKEVSDAGLAAESAAVRKRLAEREHAEHVLELRMQQALLAKYTLRAPFGGYVSQRHKEVGEAVEAGEPIVELAQLDSLRVTVDCPLDWADRVRPFDQLTVADRNGRSTRTAVVRFVNRRADAASQTVRVELVIDNADLGWRAGEQVRVLWPAEARPVAETASVGLIVE